jgi:hypothetical protein
MLRDGVIALEFDSTSTAGLPCRQPGTKRRSDFAASEYVVTHDDRTLDDFTLGTAPRTSARRDARPWQRLTLRRARNAEKSVESAVRASSRLHILTTSYHNTSDAPLRLALELRHRLPTAGTVRHWCILQRQSRGPPRLGAARSAGFEQGNQGMNGRLRRRDWSYVWRRDIRLAVGHVERSRGS